MLIALWENHHASGVALKGLATWAGAVNDSDPCANFYTRSKRRSSVTAKARKKVATVATSVAMCQASFYVRCRRCRRCRKTYIHAQRKDPL